MSMTVIDHCDVVIADLMSRLGRLTPNLLSLRVVLLPTTIRLKATN